MDGWDVPPGLLAVAEDGETGGIPAGNDIGGSGGGRGGADGGDLARVEDGDGGARLRIEQSDDALVRPAAFLEIVGKDADQLGEIGRASCRERVCQYVKI